MNTSESEDRFLQKQKDFIEWFLRVTTAADPQSDQGPPQPCTPPPCQLPNLWRRSEVF